MKTLLKDKIALCTAFVGVVLMILTLIWRVNPIEGSVMPNFLTRTEWGRVVIVVLCVTCMPAAIVGLLIAYGLGFVLCLMLPVSEDDIWIPACVLMIILQAALYFGIGKLLSLFVRKLRKGRTAAENADPPS